MENKKEETNKSLVTGQFDKVGIAAEQMKKAAENEDDKKVVKATQDDEGGMNNSGERIDNN